MYVVCVHVFSSQDLYLSTQVVLYTPGFYIFIFLAINTCITCLETVVLFSKI